MYGKNTLDKIYLTQKKLLPPSLYLPKGETLHSFKDELLFPLKLKGELQFAPTALCSLFTAPCSLTPVHCSLFTALCSLLYALCSLTPVHCSLTPVH